MIRHTRNAKTSFLLTLTLFLSLLMVMGDVGSSFAREGKRGGGGGGGAHVGRGGGGGKGGDAKVRTGRTNVVKSDRGSAASRRDVGVNRRDTNISRRDVDRKSVNVNRRDVDINRRNVNIERDVHVHRDVDIDVDHDYGWGWGWGWGAAAAVGTAVAVGTYVATLPTGCSTVYVGDTVYQRCGPTYYMPVYQGTTVTYQVVPAP